MSETLPMKREPMTLEEHLRQLEQRRAALGREIVVPRNPGTRRTASKRALLEAIEVTGAKW